MTDDGQLEMITRLVRSSGDRHIIVIYVGLAKNRKKQIRAYDSDLNIILGIPTA